MYLSTKAYTVVLLRALRTHNLLLLKLKDPITGQKQDTIFIIVNKFTKWGYFIVYIEKILVKDIVQIYIKEVFVKHGVLIKIISDRDIKFIALF